MGIYINQNSTAKRVDGAAGPASSIAYGNTNVASALDDNTGAIEAIVNVTGSKNLVPYPYTDTTKTENGLTFTDNEGVVTVSAGSYPFTVATDTYFRFFDFDTVTFEKDTYKINGTPNTNTDENICIQYTYIYGGQYNTVRDYGSGTSFTVGSDVLSSTLRIYFLAGAVLTEPLTFKPMIYDARIKDLTWVPNAMTNRQLTESIGELNGNYNPVMAHKVDISSYSAGMGNQGYLCPTDGYVHAWFDHTISALQFMTVMMGRGSFDWSSISSHTFIKPSEFANGYFNQMIFVKKGTVLWVNLEQVPTDTSRYFIQFVPVENY